jgi:predicted protein tyrosine phosphatase
MLADWNEFETDCAATAAGAASSVTRSAVAAPAMVTANSAHRPRFCLPFRKRQAKAKKKQPLGLLSL